MTNDIDSIKTLRHVALGWVLFLGRGVLVFFFFFFPFNLVFY